jgi:homoaconitate hydratase
LQARGIQLVLAGSFSQTYKRNAINNGFLVIEAPKLIENLAEEFGTEELTIRTKLRITINFKNAEINVNGENYRVRSIGQAAQELILTGGLENWVKKQIKN